MTNLFKQYKPFLLFLIGFFGSYLLLVGAYKFYLAQFDAEKFETDGMTVMVSKQTSWFTNFIGQDSKIAPSAVEASYDFYIYNKNVFHLSMLTLHFEDVNHCVLNHNNYSLLLSH